MYPPASFPIVTTVSYTEKTLIYKNDCKTLDTQSKRMKQTNSSRDKTQEQYKKHAKSATTYNHGDQKA